MLGKFIHTYLAKSYSCGYEVEELLITNSMVSTISITKSIKYLSRYQLGDVLKMDFQVVLPYLTYIFKSYSSN